ncbi:MAG: PAS domain-containing protein [candidate division Zixibacteria bacterium]|nr:PAS domain-containing protein [candidate division Zixibacteria bacterium]
MSSKTKAFRWEVRLGLALIVLVLVILNFASHYTLHRVRQSLDDSIKDRLSEAAVVVSNTILKQATTELADSLIADISYTYNLDYLRVIHMNYERILAIQAGQPIDTVLGHIDVALTGNRLMPLLQNQPIYLHASGSEITHLLFPAKFTGSDYVINVADRNSLLGSLENAGKILVFFAVLGILIITYVATRFARLVMDPFIRLRQKAEESGRFDSSADDEVTELISSYEQIIDDLRANEEELVRLNRIITKHAENLEVYNDHILRSIPTGIITFDLDQKISTINRAAEEILHPVGESYQGKPFCAVYGEYPALDELLTAVIASGEPVHNVPVPIPERGNDGKMLAVSVSHLTDSDGGRIGLSLLVNDQTALMRLQEEVELNRRMASLGEMSTGLAHQLRNAAAAMVGFANLISKKTAGDDPVRQNAEFLLKEAKEVEALVARFLDFARPLHLSPVEFDLYRLLESIVGLYAPKYQNVNLRLKRMETSRNLMVGDELLLKQAISNIVHNACAAVAGEENPCGEVVIDVSIGQEITIRISDNGSGIPEEYRENIFTPFFSGSPSGTGLGLPLARKIVTLHDGMLDFYCGDDGGTTFTITLPKSAWSDAASVEFAQNGHSA